jgi:hypothetical protein
MSECEHKHTGSCSPAGVYLYVKCMDCGAILNESEDGRRLRAGCPGFKAERYASGSCEHCHHDAQYHCDSLRARLAEADALIAKGLAVVHDFLPNIGRCVLQDYQRMNEFCSEAAARTAVSAVQPERCCVDYPRCDCNSPAGANLNAEGTKRDWLRRRK